MKNIIVLLCLVLGAGTVAMAQSKYRTDISMREQIVSNKVPGATYKDAATTTSPQRASAPQKSSGMLLKENAVPGMKYKTGNTGAQKESPETASSESKVASDRKAEKPEAQKIPEPPQLTQ